MMYAAHAAVICLITRKFHFSVDVFSWRSWGGTMSYGELLGSTCVHIDNLPCVHEWSQHEQFWETHLQAIGGPQAYHLRRSSIIRNTWQSIRNAISSFTQWWRILYVWNYYLQQEERQAGYIRRALWELRGPYPGGWERYDERAGGQSSLSGW